MAKGIGTKGADHEPVVKPCTCNHEYQDKQYGKGLRLMIRQRPKSNVPEYTCSVCGSKR